MSDTWNTCQGPEAAVADVVKGGKVSGYASVRWMAQAYQAGEAGEALGVKFKGAPQNPAIEPGKNI